MFTLDGIRKFHSWTHASLTLLFDHLATLSAADYAKELPGFGYPSIHAQVVHLLGCEVRWVSRLRALPVGSWDTTLWPAITDARTLQAEARLQTLDYLSGLTDQRLNANAELRFTDGVSHSEPLRWSCITSSPTPSITKDRSWPCAASSAILHRTPTSTSSNNRLPLCRPALR